MKKNRFAKVVAALLVMLTLTGTVQAVFPGAGYSAMAAVNDCGYYTVTARNGLNLRLSASHGSDILTVVPYGYTVCVTEIKQSSEHITFGKVDHDGQTGWIALHYAAKQDSKDMVESGLYVMQSAVDNNTVADVDKQCTDPGTRIQAYHPNGTNAQKVRLVYVGDGHYAIFMGCTDNMVFEADPSENSQVKLAEYCGADEQLWLIDRDGDYFRIISNRGYHMEIPEGKTVDHTPVTVGYGRKDACQLWSFLPTELCKPAKTVTAGKMDVPDFKQYDARWRSVKIGSKSIWRVGCLVTAISMLHSYTTGETVYPHQMRNNLKFDNNDLIWGSITKYGYNHTVYYKKVNNDLLCRIYDSLEEGKPVVIGGRGRTSHWIIITGCSKTGKNNLRPEDFHINDPGSSKRDNLGEFLRDYPTVIATLS